MTYTDDVFDELSRDFDNEFKEKNKKLPAEIAYIKVAIPIFEYYDQLDDEEIDEILEENKNKYSYYRHEISQGTYTMADMLAWYEQINDGQPWHIVLTFGHGKDRIWGEGQFGAFPAGMARAAERAFIKLLGEERYKAYLERLMEASNEAKHKEETRPIIKTLGYATHLEKLAEASNEVKQNEETIQVPKVSMQIIHKSPILKIPKQILNNVEPSTINNIPIPMPIKEQPKKKQIKVEEEKKRLKA